MNVTVKLELSPALVRVLMRALREARRVAFRPGEGLEQSALWKACIGAELKLEEGVIEACIGEPYYRCLCHKAWGRLFARWERGEGKEVV